MDREVEDIMQGGDGDANDGDGDVDLNDDDIDDDSDNSSIQDVTDTYGRHTGDESQQPSSIDSDDGKFYILSFASIQKLKKKRQRNWFGYSTTKCFFPLVAR